MIKRILIILLAIVPFIGNSQTVGYLGKRTSFDLELVGKLWSLVDEEEEPPFLGVRPHVIFALSNRFSLSASVGVKNSTEKTFTFEEYVSGDYIITTDKYKMSGYDVKLELRYFSKANGIAAPLGKFYGLVFTAPSLNLENSVGSNYKYNSPSLAISFGKRWIIKDFVNIEFATTFGASNFLLSYYDDGSYYSESAEDYLTSYARGEDYWNISLKVGYLAF